MVSNVKLIGKFLPSIIRISSILIGAYVLNIVARFSVRKILSKTKIGQEERVATLIKVFYGTFNFIIWPAAILMILPEIGINITPLLAGLGVAGLAIGMGARDLIADYLAGLFILLEDQFRVGEEVETAGFKGKVISMSLRRTILEGEEGNIYFIPNGQINKVVNHSRKPSDFN